MAADRSYIAENDRERRRLEALVGKLDDAELRRPMPDGWTVASVLAHLAFWDQRIPTFIDLLARGEKVPEENPIDVAWINAAAKPTQLALLPGRAATLAVETARAVDAAVAAMSDELLAKNAAAGSPIKLQRSEHRREHLDEIEQALAERSGRAVDEDLETMTREQLMIEAKRLRAGIRKHRDSTGHDLCWHHPALWGLLPERTDPVPTVPSWPDFLRGCLRYRLSLDEQLPNAPRSDAPYEPRRLELRAPEAP